MRTNLIAVAATTLLTIAGPAAAQTTVPGPAVAVEIYNPVDGSNRFTVGPEEELWAHVLVRPGTQTAACDVPCAQGVATVAGGTANLATAVIDVAFDTGVLEYLGAESNPFTPAVDGLLQEQHAPAGRIGWALAGDWTPDADPSGALADPCQMGRLTTARWVFRIHLRARPGVAAGTETTLRLRRETDSPPFPLSFADVCGGPAFKQSAGTVGQVVDAVVTLVSEPQSRLRNVGDRYQPDTP